jgi:hypothetical protein
VLALLIATAVLRWVALPLVLRPVVVSVAVWLVVI